MRWSLSVVMAIGMMATIDAAPAMASPTGNSPYCLKGCNFGGNGGVGRDVRRSVAVEHVDHRGVRRPVWMKDTRDFVLVVAQHERVHDVARRRGSRSFACTTYSIR